MSVDQHIFLNPTEAALVSAHLHREAHPMRKTSIAAALAALALLAGPTLSTDGHGPIAPSSTDGHQGERGLDLDAASS